MIGSLEFIVIEFPGNRFRGEIMPVLYDMIDKGLIRIIDLVFIHKDERGDISSYELGEADNEITRLFSSLDINISNLISKDDIEKVGQALNNNSAAGILLFEHRWSLELIEAIKNAHGRLVVDYKVPQETVEELLVDLA